MIATKWSIGLSARLYDLESPRLFSVDLKKSELFDYERRVSRTALLSGGVYLNDTGYSAGDRTIDLSLTNPSEDEAGFLIYLLQTHPEISVVTRDGSYIGVIRSITGKGGGLRVSIYLSEEVSN